MFGQGSRGYFVEGARGDVALDLRIPFVIETPLDLLAKAQELVFGKLRNGLLDFLDGAHGVRIYKPSHFTSASAARFLDG